MREPSSACAATACAWCATSTCTSGEEEITETKRKLGGGEEKTRRYKYSRAWSDKPVDSCKFKERTGHGNPQMTWGDRNALAREPKLGAFAVPETLLANYGEEQPLAATAEQAAALQRSKQAGAGGRRRPQRRQDPASRRSATAHQVRRGQAAGRQHRGATGGRDLRALSNEGRRHGRADRRGPGAGGRDVEVGAGQQPRADLEIRAGGGVLMFVGFSMT